MTRRRKSSPKKPSPIKTLRLRRTSITPERTTYQIVRAPSQFNLEESLDETTPSPPIKPSSALEVRPPIRLLTEECVLPKKDSMQKWGFEESAEEDNADMPKLDVNKETPKPNSSSSAKNKKNKEKTVKNNNYGLEESADESNDDEMVKKVSEEITSTPKKPKNCKKKDKRTNVEKFEEETQHENIQPEVVVASSSKTSLKKVERSNDYGLEDSLDEGCTNIVIEKSKQNKTLKPKQASAKAQTKKVQSDEQTCATKIDEEIQAALSQLNAIASRGKHTSLSSSNYSFKDPSTTNRIEQRESNNGLEESVEGDTEMPQSMIQEEMKGLRVSPRANKGKRGESYYPWVEDFEEENALKFSKKNSFVKIVTVVGEDEAKLIKSQKKKSTAKKDTNIKAKQFEEALVQPEAPAFSALNLESVPSTSLNPKFPKEATDTPKKSPKKKTSSKKDKNFKSEGFENDILQSEASVSNVNPSSNEFEESVPCVEPFETASKSRPEARLSSGVQFETLIPSLSNYQCTDEVTTEDVIDMINETLESLPPPLFDCQQNPNDITTEDVIDMLNEMPELEVQEKVPKPNKVLKSSRKTDRKKKKEEVKSLDKVVEEKVQNEKTMEPENIVSEVAVKALEKSRDIFSSSDDEDKNLKENIPPEAEIVVSQPKPEIQSSTTKTDDREVVIDAPAAKDQQQQPKRFSPYTPEQIEEFKARKALQEPHLGFPTGSFEVKLVTKNRSCCPVFVEITQHDFRRMLPRLPFIKPKPESET